MPFFIQAITMIVDPDSWVNNITDPAGSKFNRNLQLGSGSRGKMHIFIWIRQDGIEVSLPSFLKVILHKKKHEKNVYGSKFGSFCPQGTGSGFYTLNVKDYII